MRRTLLFLATASLSAAALATFAVADTWPRFRGVNGDGQGQADAIPSAFTDADYAWTLPLVGKGHSSPVVWNDRVFITAADPETNELLVSGVSLATGKELWQKRFPSSPHKIHLANSFATSTPAVDDEQIYVAWRDGETIRMAALTHDGADAWQYDLGPLGEVHGFGASPMVAGDIVCMTHDTLVANESFIVGVNRHTGKEAWRTPCGEGKTSYATPCLWETPEGESLLLMHTMSKGLTAYAPATGAIVWNAFTQDLPDRCVSSPIVASGVALISCGSANNGKLLIGAKLGGAKAPPVEAYRLKQSIPNIPTPVAADDMVFLWHDSGIVTCIDAATGKSHWRERVGGVFHCSPLHIGDRIFCISLTGEVVVIAASKEYKLIARNQLAQTVDGEAVPEKVTATPAIAEGRLLIRTETSLICLGGKR